MDAKRCIIFPHTPVWADAERAIAFSVLLRLGGDVQRIFEPGSKNASQFAAYLKRLRISTEGDESPLVVITETLPLFSCVLNCRTTLVEAIPALASAIWLIWYDGRRDITFRGAAEQIGAFDHPSMDEFPILKLRDASQRFLIVTPMSVSMPLLDIVRVRLFRPLPRRP